MKLGPDISEMLTQLAGVPGGAGRTVDYFTTTAGGAGAARSYSAAEVIGGRG